MSFWESFKIAVGLWGSFGIFIGAISIANLTIGYFDFGFSYVIEKVFGAYIWVFHEVVWGFIWNILSMTVPEWINDTLTLWFLCSGTSIRTLITLKKYSEINSAKLGNIEKYLFSRSIWQYNIFAVFISILLWPILFIRFAYSKAINFKSDYADLRIGLHFQLMWHENTISYRSIWLIQLFSMLGLAVLLILTNAGLPAAS